ncbi:hypothetical protein DPMN_068493 [Dreissena polymorpha]|uniref:Uncharacterized protein n=1 Tax=Dreissena polymorpha TaxID=45954 RepID=A0A9D3YXR1_DREPO|nr:hypothetical protein DPMN_068493 [Dreissena polymorpha]
MEQFKHHQVSINHREMLLEEQPERKIKKFLCDYRKYHPNVVVSTDGSRTLIKTPSAGKKPANVKENEPIGQERHPQKENFKN